ncbi:MAG TPA: hypothetical protein VHV51_23295 [Polyangiaceae bacterium]|jgi:predicted Zn-dependent protease|nr:hypothetical protein [Polyangiaceae bacterium]
MKGNLKSSFLAVGFAVAIVLGYIFFARKMPPKNASATAESASAIASASSGASSGSASVSGKDPCEHAADRCACAAERGADLLTACFAERALQLISRAPASCATSAFLGVRAETLAAVERSEEASKVAATALQADPKNRFARRAQAIVAIQTHDYESADKILNTLASEDPKDADALFYLALSQRRRDHYNGAREGFLRVLRLNPQHIDARYNLVTLTAAAGAAQEAEHDYEELEKIAPAGDSRLIAARAALRGAEKGAPAELPVLHQGAPARAPATTVAH